MVLFMPNVQHAHDCTKYQSSESKYFHEASFDAYCVGYGRSDFASSVFMPLLFFCSVSQNGTLGCYEWGQVSSTVTALVCVHVLC